MSQIQAHLRNSSKPDRRFAEFLDFLNDRKVVTFREALMYKPEEIDQKLVFTELSKNTVFNTFLYLKSSQFFDFSALPSGSHEHRQGLPIGKPRLV